ncbi:hypothetical protein Tco_1029448 [Tanacetum coccineum]|uniref:Integrase, catalytic region, zinc finger, CCHC-type, peptidase aspartic, catalytic n=1 Tax=Tanacetum coccineum TaxID=301880 RepID=A0ABQ5G5P4_9ASTR
MDNEDTTITITMMRYESYLKGWTVAGNGWREVLAIFLVVEGKSFREEKESSLDESRSPDFDLFSDQEEYSEEEVAEIMAETMEQYMSKTRVDYRLGVPRPKIEDKDNFKLKGQFLKELRTNTFSGSDHEDANEHIKKVLEIMDLFHIPNITIDQVMCGIVEGEGGNLLTYNFLNDDSCCKAILLGADNRLPMLEKDMYDSWKSRIELYMMNRQHGQMILESVENGPLIWSTIEENGVTRPRKYSKLSATDAIQADCDVKETNIILQGLPPEVYALVSNHRISKELWEIIQLLMQGTSLTKQERECKLYDEFDKFGL